ncbi:MAG: M16 family metallopeptidase [Calditrichaceae bacterium]
MDLKIQFEQYFLDNGLRVILHEDHRIPVVAVNLWYHVGSGNERKGRTGFAHLFEHMMFQGSEHVGSDKHFKLVQSAGGNLNGSTFFDRTNYYETLPSHYLEMGLWLESDRMGFLLPAMTQEKLDNQRDVVKNERRQRVDNQPYGLWLEKILELSYPDDFSYHWPIIGYMEDLEAATLDDIRQFFKMYYAPRNASLTLAGDFDPAQARALIEKYFGEIKNDEVKPPAVVPFEGFYKGEKRDVLMDNVQLPRIYMAYHVPPYGTDEWYALDLMSDILSAGKSSRLYQSLVYDLQIAQDAFAFILPMQRSSLMIFIITPKPGVEIDFLESALEKEIERVKSDLIETGELDRVVNQIEARKTRELQSNASKADMLNMFATYFDKPELINEEIDRYHLVNPEKMRDAAQKYLNIDNRAVVTFLPKTK